MISVEEALKIVLENARELDSENVSLLEAVGRVLTEDLDARENLPPFDNSAMDGFAVKVADIAGASRSRPAVLRLKETVRAGTTAKTTLLGGQAIKVMTGAPLPAGAEAVVMREHTEEDGAAATVRIFRRAAPGENIRPKGEDVQAGQNILKRGALIRPYEVALLAAQGITGVSVARRPRVAVIATGDELAAPSTARLAPGQIRNANTPAMAAAIRRWGSEPFDLGIVADNPDHLKEAFKRAAEQADVVLVSGGVSVGDFDFTKTSLEEFGMTTIFWRVAIKPGKPLLFGKAKKATDATKATKAMARDKNVLVFGVPGNPVSTLVCLEEFVRPVLEKMQGRQTQHPSWHLFGAVDEDQRIRDTQRRHYLFCRAYDGENGFQIHVIRPQGSAMIGMTVNANAICVAEAGQSRIKKGEKLPFRWIK